MQVTGTIKLITETKEYGSNGFRKRELVIETNEQYPQTLEIEFVQDKCDILNNFGVGQEVEIGINLRGREWTNDKGETKYFNSIQGWKINSLSNNTSQSSSTPQANNPVNNPPFEPAENLNEEDHQDLPF